MGGGNVSQDQTSIICIDLKSFYASVECVERGLNPFKTNLVVADPTRSKSTICLAITPAMKSLGIKNRCRIHEIPDCVKYITAMPRMQLYMDYSAKIYGKNAIMRGSNLLECSTYRERNEQVGGHRA